LRLVDENVLDLSEAISRLTQQPATVLGILENGLGGSLGAGARADVCVFDPEQYWELNSETFISRGHNSPFIGWEMKGRVTHTLVAGQIKFGA
jgi:dihydroorotase